MTQTPRLSAALASAVLLLVASPVGAVQVRIASFNVLGGIESPGSTEYEATRAVLQRVDADIIGFQEVTGSTQANFETLAASLGYPHTYYAPQAILDTSNRTAFMSRWPIVLSSFINSPAGAQEMTRFNALVVVDVPGTTNDPTLVTVHYKCCATSTADPFRRAIEIRRTIEALQARGSDGTDNVFVIGDYNLVGSTQTINSLPSGLPTKYELGGDVSFPVQYSTNPDFYFTSLGLAKVLMRQADDVTTSTFAGGGVLDYIVTSSAVAARGYQTEIYNSAKDTSFAGLPKAGSPLASATSTTASDHYLIFGDFELDSGATTPSLMLMANPTSIPESGGDGSVTFTVRIPTAPAAGQTLTVDLASSDSSELVLAANSVTFTAGVTAIDVPATPLNDRQADGDQTVTVTASATGYTSATAQVTVTDVGAAVSSGRNFTSLGEEIIDRFDNFIGNGNPVDWTVTDVAGAAVSTWLGRSSGGEGTGGRYSYGTNSDGSLGFLPTGTQSVNAATVFTNSTRAAIASLDIRYTAEQWRAALNGNTNGWTVEIVSGGITNTIPALAFNADNTRATGAIAGGSSNARSATVAGLNIPHGETFELRFRGDAGAGGSAGGESWISTTNNTRGSINTGQSFGAKSGAWINEFHYDNISTDSGEFVEVVLAPDVTTPLAQISVVLYNGNGGVVYGTHALSTFTEGETVGGYRIFHKAISGIQNGDPDGIALVVGSSVAQFISYEGTFSATDGAAAGLFSNDVGVAQRDSTTPVGASLQLTGSPVAASQGIAIDDLAVSIRAAAVPNAPPQILPVAPQTMAEDGTLELIVELADADTALANVSLTATSSNQSLLPDSSLVVSGTGAQRSLLLEPARDASGEATVTLTANDGEDTTTISFVLTVTAVNDGPSISEIPDLSLASGATSGTSSFNVSDPDSPSLQLTATSSNTNLLPVANITFGGSGSNRTVTVNPVAGRSGTATVTVTVSDGTLNAETSFLVTVAPPPTSGTYALGGLPATIADGTRVSGIMVPRTTTFTLNVPDSRTIAMVRVAVSVSHSYMADLSAVLCHPDGTAVTLINRRGGSGNNMTGTVFDDTATAAISGAAPPFSGTFRPETALSAFTGKATAGAWKLEITDHDRGDTGSLQTWELRLSTVNVDTTAPSITVLGDNPLTLAIGANFTDPGATALDDVDGIVDVTASGEVNTALPGSYTITYTATDAAGNTATATRTVNVVDVTAPVISVAGDDPLYLPVGAAFLEPGVSAFDAVDGDVAVQTGGTVDTTTRGTYTLTYTATDAAGNEATATRTVIVRSGAAHLLETQYGLTGASAPLTTDADNDGVSNLMEYAFGTDPSASNSAPAATELVFTGDAVRFSALVRDNDNALRITPLVTTDLRSAWGDTTATEVQTLDQKNVPDGFRRHTWEVPVANAAALFIRFEVGYE